MEQASWEEQEPLNLPEYLLQDPQLPRPDEELLDFDVLDASESLLGSAETSQGGIEGLESGSLSERGFQSATAGLYAVFAGLCCGAPDLDKKPEACATCGTGRAVRTRQASRASGSIEEPTSEAGVQVSKAEAREADDRVKQKALERNKKAQRTFRQRQKVHALEALPLVPA